MATDKTSCFSNCLSAFFHRPHEQKSKTAPMSSVSPHPPSPTDTPSSNSNQRRLFPLPSAQAAEATTEHKYPQRDSKSDQQMADVLGTAENEKIILQKMADTLGKTENEEIIRQMKLCLGAKKAVAEARKIVENYYQTAIFLQQSSKLRLTMAMEVIKLWDEHLEQTKPTKRSRGYCF
jgi:hypothetical protein